MQPTHLTYEDIEVREYCDPWEDYYRQHNETTSGNNNWQQTVDNEVDSIYIEPSATNIENLTFSNVYTFTKSTDRQNDNNIVNEINASEIVQNQTDENYSNKIMHNSSIFQHITSPIEVQKLESKDVVEGTEQEVNTVHFNVKQENVAKVIQEVANEDSIKTEVYHCPKATNSTNIKAESAALAVTTTTDTASTSIDDETIEKDINQDIYIVTNHKTLHIKEDGHETNKKQTSKEVMVEERGLAGALAQLRLGEPRSPEQEAYEESMRRQAWEQGQIDYTGKDSFDNILKRITETLDNKPTKASKDAADATTGSSS